jgi:hypothetical protein
VHLRRVARQEFERAVREDDPETERRVARILLDDANVCVCTPAFRQQREEQTCGTGAGNADAHRGRGRRNARTPAFQRA